MTPAERADMVARALAAGLDWEPEDPDAAPEPETWTCRDCGEEHDWDEDQPHNDAGELVCDYCWGHYDHGPGWQSDEDAKYDDWRDKRLFGPGE